MLNYDIEDMVKSDLVVIKDDDRYYVYHNCVTDDYGEVYEEVFVELMLKANSGIVIGYWDLDSYNREVVISWLKSKIAKGEGN